MLVRQRTRLQNRIHATLAKYAQGNEEGVSDWFGARGRALLQQRFALLPPHTAYAAQQLLEQVEALDRQVQGFEQRMRTGFKATPDIRRLMTLPGVGLILAAVIILEAGTVAALHHRREVGRLCGHDAPRPREWRGIDQWRRDP